MPQSGSALSSSGLELEVLGHSLRIILKDDDDCQGIVFLDSHDSAFEDAG
jgi:hypothetical protein